MLTVLEWSRSRSRIAPVRYHRRYRPRCQSVVRGENDGTPLVLLRDDLEKGVRCGFVHLPVADLVDDDEQIRINEHLHLLLNRMAVCSVYTRSCAVNDTTSPLTDDVGIGDDAGHPMPKSTRIVVGGHRIFRRGRPVELDPCRRRHLASSCLRRGSVRR